MTQRPETHDGEPERQARTHRPDPAAISVDNCSLSFGDLSVLENVSLTVEPGEFVGFVGPNGAGKTTLLRAISGALEPAAGTVSIGDSDIHAIPSKASSRLVSVVPQDTTLSFSFPVRDVVEMGRHPHRSRFSAPTRRDQQAVERALERTRTNDLADRPIDEVSGGQRQRVVLARAIAQETPALLLDEPTGSLDINHQVETLELVRELVEEGRTVCAAIHDLDLAARYCDRLVMLADGEIYRSGPPGDVLTGDSLAAVFDATATVTPNPITGTETVTALSDRRRNGADDGPDGRALRDGRLHVLGTGTRAAGVLARLETADAGLEVSVGPVTRGDTTAETARSLEVDRIEVPPFESLSESDLMIFENRVSEADVTVLADPEIGTGGTGSQQLLEAVDGTNTPIVEATPETVLEAVGDALANRSASAETDSDAGSESSYTDSDSSSGLSAGSSSD
uniref:heme ABC transporter ATP-binding protein n=1 Tax=Natronorubrum halophilum TaxID=1702106 RepID=UPI000EF6FB51|nr:heme ABC transporter ATP-binding protein [Natronorubrum halophilum]